jgi:hypothetical protein
MKSIKGATIHSIVLGLTASFTQATAEECINGTTQTFYGWPSNSGNNTIAYNCGRGFTAQGSGTFNYPLTFATAKGEFERCEVIYSPYLKKYLIHEDDCVQCQADWNNGTGFWHIDVWDMACEDGGNDEEKCDNALAPVDQSRDVIRYPSADLEVQGKIVHRMRKHIHDCMLTNF